MAETPEHDRRYMVRVEAEVEDRAFREVAVHVLAEKRLPDEKRNRTRARRGPRVRAGRVPAHAQADARCRARRLKGRRSRHTRRSCWRCAQVESARGTTSCRSRNQLKRGPATVTKSDPAKPSGCPAPAEVPESACSSHHRLVRPSGVILELRHTYTCAHLRHRVPLSKDRSAVGNRHTLVGQRLAAHLGSCSTSLHTIVCP